MKKRKRKGKIGQTILNTKTQKNIVIFHFFRLLKYIIYKVVHAKTSQKKGCLKAHTFIFQTFSTQCFKIKLVSYLQQRSDVAQVDYTLDTRMSVPALTILDRFFLIDSSSILYLISDFQRSYSHDCMEAHQTSKISC